MLKLVSYGGNVTNKVNRLILGLLAESTSSKDATNTIHLTRKGAAAFRAACVLQGTAPVNQQTGRVPLGLPKGQWQHCWEERNERSLMPH